MINANQNILFTATILALCVISFVHVFLFPLYDINAKHTTVKRYADFEQRICKGNIKRRVVFKHRRCPQQGIVTVEQGGRLGNQMWAYASVWAIGRRTGLETYVPQCIRAELDKVFDVLSVPSFEEIGHCELNRFVRSVDSWNYTNQSIILKKYTMELEIVLSWVQDIIQEFSFRRALLVRSQKLLREASKGKSGSVFVGIHVRRTDYIGYLQRKLHINAVGMGFYRKAMGYFLNKYKNVTFIVVSDDPGWCQAHFKSYDNVYIASEKNKAADDLAILASCNHTIFDYGTFGTWGAILAGGETVCYNLTHHISTKIVQILPNWHLMK
ncbi:galactoside 2-alpha-L-fucosyltransferase Sec1-like [Onthophagus taurus]|uniref:galactoside 2-alpha-L-fucosyltransferase Sec1-like n=1 Tax=Onthophagus taurus TaxID=166361 RepID=UPI000C20B06E|nr:galactoside 2-alpha-L-fucosyltransferase 3-like [Onthophagus taurus]